MFNKLVTALIYPGKSFGLRSRLEGVVTYRSFTSAFRSLAILAETLSNAEANESQQITNELSRAIGRN